MVANVKHAKVPAPAKEGSPRHGVKRARPEPAPAEPERQESSDNLMMQQLYTSGMIQPRLQIAPPDDPLEREADDAADAVVQRKEACSCGGTCGACREEEQTVRRKARHAHRDSQMASSKLPRRLGPGRRLDPTTRRFFESRMGHDFSATRIHTGRAADRAARSIDARAFTFGRDVAFGAGEYAPHTAEGQRLIAHELTHTVQQRGTQPALQRQYGGHKAEPYLRSASLSMQFPGGATIVDQWNDVYTERPTTLKLTLTEEELAIDFSPALIVDVQWPVSDLWIGGATLSRKTFGIAVRSGYRQTVGTRGAVGSAAGAMSSWIRGLVKGTSLELPAAPAPAPRARPPSAKPPPPLPPPPASPRPRPSAEEAKPESLPDTLMQIAGNLGRGGGKGISPSEITKVTVGVAVSFPEPITRSADGAGARIEGTVNAAIVFDGTAETVQDAGNRSITSLTISGPTLFITKDGSDVGRIASVTVHHGGAVSIGGLEVLHGTAGLESILRILILREALLSDPVAQVGAKLGLVDADTDPTIVHGLVMRKLKSAIGPAVLEGIRANCLTVPDLDLCTGLGL